MIYAVRHEDGQTLNVFADRMQYGCARLSPTGQPLNSGGEPEWPKMLFAVNSGAAEITSLMNQCSRILAWVVQSKEP